MNLDHDICYCYHVSLRKLRNFARRENLRKPSQMSECLNAGTGCGWCIPVLKQVFEASQQDGGDEVEMASLTPEEYAARRQEYIREKKPRHQF